MLDLNTAPSPRRTPRLVVGVADTASAIRAAQKLRYDVFATEMGATLASAAEQTDRDDYDAICDHLIVTETATGRVVGTYRMLPPGRAHQAPMLYSEHEFDLSRLAHIRPRLVEVGRSCVHPDFRSGAVIALLWAGLADYVRRVGGDYLAGCASVSLADGGHQAVSLYRYLEQRHLAPADWRVFPHLPLPLGHVDDALDVAMPPLIKGYLRAGSLVCGEPAWDPDFNCADFFMLMPIDRVDARYARRFMGE